MAAPTPRRIAVVGSGVAGLTAAYVASDPANGAHVTLLEADERLGGHADTHDVTDPTGRYLPPEPEELKAFRDHLQIVGAPIARRYSGGKEIGAACGTLEASSYGGEVILPPTAT